MSESANTDILNISDLVSGYESDGASGGCLRFDAISQNSDGTTTLKLTISTENTSVENVPLATIVMAGTEAVCVDAGNFTQHVLEQLVQHNDIVF